MSGVSVTNITGGRSGGPFTFITGVLALLTSASIDLYQHNKQELENQEYRESGLNHVVQSNRYDGNRPYLMDHYDYTKVMDNIKREYPRMADINAYHIAFVAIAKKLMESETPYKYDVPEKFRFIGNIERFVTEDCRAIVGGRR